MSEDNWMPSKVFFLSNLLFIVVAVGGYELLVANHVLGTYTHVRSAHPTNLDGCLVLTWLLASTGVIAGAFWSGLRHMPESTKACLKRQVVVIGCSISTCITAAVLFLVAAEFPEKYLLSADPARQSIGLCLVASMLVLSLAIFAFWLVSWRKISAS